MANKRITTELVVKATDHYSRMIQKISSVTGRFADKVRTDVGGLQKMRGPLRLIADFRKKQQALKASGTALDAANEKTRQLLATIKTTKNPTAQMRRDFDRARTAAERLEERHRRNRAELHGLQKQMRSAGVNTSDLAGEQRRLTNALDAGNTALARRSERMQRLKVMQDRIMAGRERMDRSLARSANLSFVGNASMATGRRILTGMASPIKQAIDFESAMSDVRKVVDFESPAAFREMSDDILNMSKRIPIAASGLAAIFAAGGQSGIETGELSRFAEMAAKIGVAFDISAEKSGESMARIKTAMDLDLDQTGSLFDAMNYLSNNSAARAEQTLAFLNRAGADGSNFGFKSTETLAIGAAMIASGAGADTAATSFRNMGRALTRGESATDRQSGAMERLGLKSKDVARSMQDDAVGTTMDVMRRLNELPDHLRASVMSDLFGDEARELTKLINNMQLMPEMLGLVADETKYLGSAEAEYAERSKTTANNMQLMRNQTTRLGISIGEIVLPHLNDLLAKSQAIIDTVVAWTKENPKLTKGLVIGGLALGAMAIAGGALLTAGAGLIGTMAVLRFGLIGLGARAAFAAGGIGGIGKVFGGLMRLPKFALASLLLPVRWTAKLISKIPWLALAGGLKWSALVKPLAWIGRGALRVIPGIGWAVLAGELAWSLLIKPLGWDEYLPSIDWSRVWASFSWEGWLPEMEWSKFVTAIEWPDWIDQIDWSNWFSFEWKTLLPLWDWTAIIPRFDIGSRLLGADAPSGSSSDPAEVKHAQSRGQSLGYGREVTPLAGARALGGPVRAGLPYLVNENTPRSEIMVPSASGGILNVGQAQAAFRMHLANMPQGTAALRGAKRVYAASEAAMAGYGRMFARPQTASGQTASASAPESRAGRGNVTVEINGGINIAVPSGVTDPERIATLAVDLLEQRVEDTFAASFSD